MYDSWSPGWQRRSLASLGRYDNGYAFNEMHWSEHGLPIVRIAQITGSQNVVDRFPGVLANTFRLRDDDLIFAWSGTLAVIRWVGGPAWLNQHLFKVTPAADIDPSFLFHVLQASVAEMDKRAHGSTMKHIKRGELRDYLVDIPVERIEQQKVARILDALDTAIRETEAIIGKLKAVKQGLLHDLLTRGIDANGDLRPPPSEAPHLYQPSFLGPVPNEWSVGPLIDWLSGKPRNGYSPQEAPSWTGIQMLGLACLTFEGFAPIQLKPAPLGDQRLMQALLKDGDLLISRSNTSELVGLVGVYRNVGTACTYPDLMMRLTPNDKTNSEFLELVLQTSQSRRQIKAMASGTSGSMMKITGSGVSALKVTLPDPEEQSRILQRLATQVAKLKSENDYVATLKALKSGLMDDLLTGRVRVTPLLEGTMRETAGM